MNENSSSFAKGRLRRLSSDEIALWLSVAKTVAPLPTSQLPSTEVAKPEIAKIDKPEPAKEAHPKAAPTPAPAPQSEAARPPPLAPLDRRLRQKLSRGRAGPDAAIDLHGLTSQEAHIALRQFLLNAQSEGAKLVLVVTGKGERGGFDERVPGVLRRSVPLWLRAAEYHSLVVGFEEASRPHGGAGALYVRLRRRDRVKRDEI
jgi:DNA-nicking Smr family endonuclease